MTQHNFFTGDRSEWQAGQLGSQTFPLPAAGESPSSLGPHTLSPSFAQAAI